MSEMREDMNRNAAVEAMRKALDARGIEVTTEDLEAAYDAIPREWEFGVLREYQSGHEYFLSGPFSTLKNALFAQKDAERNQGGKAVVRTRTKGIPGPWEEVPNE